MDIYSNVLDLVELINSLYLSYRKEKEQLELQIFNNLEQLNELQINLDENNIDSKISVNNDNFILKLELEWENEHLSVEKNKINEKISEIDSFLSVFDTNRYKEKNIVQVLKEQINSLNENERKRIARDLHDIIIQNLVCLIHKIELATKYIDNDPVRTRLELGSVSKDMKEVISDVRSLVYDLRPMSFDDLGFQTMLDYYFQELEDTYDITIKKEINFNQKNLDNSFLLTIFRMIKECCINSIKHSGGSDICIKLVEKGNFIYIEIIDKGLGCDLNKPIDKHHYGLGILQERVSLLSGECEIISEPEKGFHVKLKFPFNKEE